MSGRSLAPMRAFMSGSYWFDADNIDDEEIQSKIYD